MFRLFWHSRHSCGCWVSLTGSLQISTAIGERSVFKSADTRSQKWTKPSGQSQWNVLNIAGVNSSHLVLQKPCSHVSQQPRSPVRKKGKSVKSFPRASMTSSRESWATTRFRGGKQEERAGAGFNLSFLFPCEPNIVLEVTGGSISSPFLLLGGHCSRITGSFLGGRDLPALLQPYGVWKSHLQVTGDKAAPSTFFPDQWEVKMLILWPSPLHYTSSPGSQPPFSEGTRVSCEWSSSSSHWLQVSEPPAKLAGEAGDPKGGKTCP